MATHAQPMTRVPSFVGVFSPIAQRLLRIGIPLGPNALITISGRRSGLPRTTPVALVDIGGRRWVLGTFGEVNWVRNLRAAHEATITVGKRRERVAASELSRSDAADFFADVLGPYIRRVPFGQWMIGSMLGAREILENPTEAAARRPVFELHPMA